jgi:hypothetical protein
MSEQIVTLQVVHEWKEDSVTIAQVPSEVIVSNVNSSQVPVLVVEEVDNVCCVKQIYQNHAVSDIAVLFVLSTQKRKIYQSPSDNPRSSVVEQLEVPELSKSGVHLDSHEEIIHD